MLAKRNPNMQRILMETRKKHGTTSARFRKRSGLVPTILVTMTFSKLLRQSK